MKQSSSERRKELLFLKYCVRMHRELWRRLAKTGAQTRSDAVDYVIEKNGITLMPPTADCFCCHYRDYHDDYQAVDAYSRLCDKRCFIDWGVNLKYNIDGTCKSPTSLFYQWCVTKPRELNKRRQLASKIANLPLTDWAIKRLGL